MISYAIRKRGEEVISERHQKDFRFEGLKADDKCASEDFTDLNFEYI